MRKQTRYSCGKVSIGLCAAVVLTLCAFAWMTKAYFSVRLELMEARGVLADILHGSGIIGNCLAAGNIEKAHGIAVSNQLKGIQYAVRRNVEDRNIHQATDYCFKKNGLPMSEEQRGFYIQYDNGYRSWSSSGWFDDNIPLMDQVMEVLQYYWPDCRPRWTTWKPRDFATNIKIGSPEERPKKRESPFKDQKSLSERLDHALEQSDLGTNGVVATYPEVPRSIGLCFDSLLAWQSGDTNEFHRILHESEYDSHLRDVLRNSIKKGSDDEVLRWVNLFLNNWIVVEAGHSRNYEWPDSETDRTAWDLLLRIHANRQQYPCSTGDIGVDATIKRILDKTSEKDSSGHKGNTP